MRPSRSTVCKAARLNGTRQGPGLVEKSSNESTLRVVWFACYRRNTCSPFCMAPGGNERAKGASPIRRRQGQAAASTQTPTGGAKHRALPSASPPPDMPRVPVGACACGVSSCSARMPRQCSLRRPCRLLSAEQDARRCIEVARLLPGEACGPSRAARKARQATWARRSRSSARSGHGRRGHVGLVWLSA